MGLPMSANNPRRDPCDMAALKTRCFEFNGGGETCAIDADDRRRTIRSDSFRLGDAELPFEHIRKTDNNESKVHQYDMK